jgi:FlaA1/EpsC-like NDP-sugar epimerase
MLAAAAATAAHFFTFRRFGFHSTEYVYVYYYTDSLLTILLFFAIWGLYEQVFKQMAVSQYIRVTAALLLVGTALVSYLIVRENQTHLVTRFVVELAQNLYFVGLLLTLLLWGAVTKLKETRARLVHLILSLGIYFSANAAIYAVRNLFPGAELTKMLIPLVGTFLPLAWAYTFTRIPEEARLAPARVATAHR